MRRHAWECDDMRLLVVPGRNVLPTVTVFQRLGVTPLRLTNSCLAIVRDELNYQNLSVPYCVINAVAHAPALIG